MPTRAPTPTPAVRFTVSIHSSCRVGTVHLATDSLILFVVEFCLSFAAWDCPSGYCLENLQCAPGRKNFTSNVL